MKAKIEWYQEVLELEPSSKVFFPLARLLAENGQPADAVKTLRTGLERHPEFFEARLLLIELLHTLGQNLDRDTEVYSLSRVLSSYPRFWDAWSACTASGKGGRDVSVALRFIAASESSPGLSFASVMEAGLSSLTGLPATAAQTVRAEDSPRRKEPVADEPADSGAMADETPSASPFVSLDDTALRTLIGDRGASDDGLPGEGASDSIPSPGLLQAEAEEEDEPFSLRTRSMAEVLAEQGDTQGALDIYQELLASADSPESRAAIQFRIDELRSGATSTVVADEAPAAVEEAPLQGKHKLLHMLEMLAERLETRAHS